MSDPFALALQDIVDHLSVKSRSGASEVHDREFRLSAINAYRYMMQESDWNYYLKHYRVFMQAPYLTGTVTYDDANKSLTLVGGTWPSWAEYGRVEIGEVTSPVASRDSSTVLTMHDTLNFGADASIVAVSYTLNKSTYQLPTDWRSNFSMADEQDRWQSSFIRPEDWLNFSRRTHLSSGPFYWTILQDPRVRGRWILEFYGNPDENQTMDFMYQGMGRDARLTGYETTSRAGVITITASSSAVTGSGTNFKASHIGSLLRVSGDTVTLPDGHGGLNPFDEQIEILSVTSATALTLSSSITSTAGYTGVKYVITDPIDVDESLDQLVKAYAEYELAKFQDAESLPSATQLLRLAKLQARENDSRRGSIRNRSGSNLPRVTWRGISVVNS